MAVRVALLLVITGITFIAMGWLGVVGPGLLFLAAGIGGFALDGALNEAEANPEIPILKALASVDHAPKAA